MSMINPVADAAARVAEFLRQYGMSNLGDGVYGVCTDPNAELATLNASDLRLLVQAATTPPSGAVAEISLGFGTSTPAELKVALVRAMGFTPMRDPHDYSCPQAMADDGEEEEEETGYLCQCVPPATRWSQPQDVDELRGETWEQRAAKQAGTA